MTPSFHALFSRSPEVTASAPGRVNLIGEHTDYNGGFVLPMPVPQRTHVELAKRDVARARVWSAGFSREAPVEYELGQEAPRRGWIDYVQGLTAILRGMGCEVGGFDMRITSQVPPGAGLGSSAALEVAALRALRFAFGLALDDMALARVGQRAECEFVGAPVGIMDQAVASLGASGSALFIDTRTLETERVALPVDSALIVIDSGVKHGHAYGEYRMRRAECERAASSLGVAELRDVSIDHLDQVATLPPPLDRRARHVVTENARVLETVRALGAGDLRRVGALLAASHRSMRDDYEVSIPEVDVLVQAAGDDADVFGARLTGGGFGGAVIALARAGCEADAAGRIAIRYREATGRAGTILLPVSAAEADAQS